MSDLARFERLAPMTWAMAFIERPFESVQDALLSWRREFGRQRERPTLTTEELTGSIETLLPRLLPLSDAHDRELIVETANGQWTAYFDNGIHGSDVSAPRHLARILDARVILASSQPHTMTHSGEGTLGGTQFQLLRPDLGVDELLRVVSATHQGSGWRWDAAGEALPFEDVARYGSRLVRDRFTRDMLDDYCREFGIGLYDPTFYGPSALLTERSGLAWGPHWTLAMARRYHRLDADDDPSDFGR